MNFRKSQKERAGAVRDFLSSNKLFLAIALLAALWTGGGLLNGKQPESPPETAQTGEAVPEWRFYPSDLVILAVGGGFCSVMIIRERRKAKEELD